MCFAAKRPRLKGGVMTGFLRKNRSTATRPSHLNSMAAASLSLARLRLVAAANMRLAVAAAFRRALALVQLRGLFVAHLVGVVFNLAGVGFLFVARILLVRHDGFLEE